MAWYHDEWNKQNALEQAEAQKQYIIQQSNFWATLQRQIEQDVAGINDSPWKDRLAGFPLTAKQHIDEFVIRKSSYPQILITLRHQGDYVGVVRELVGKEAEDQYSGEEQLQIGSDGKQVYLQTESNKRLAVPEQAAQYILTPIIQSLKTTIPS